MKKIFILFVLLVGLVGNMFAVPTWRAKDVDFTKYEVVKSNEMDGVTALNLIKLIELDTPFFEELLNNGYYDVKFDNDCDGIWFMFVNEGKILSFQMVIFDAATDAAADEEYHFVLKEWKVIKE